MLCSLVYFSGLRMMLGTKSRLCKYLLKKESLKQSLEGSEAASFYRKGKMILKEGGRSDLSTVAPKKAKLGFDPTMVDPVYTNVKP